MSNITHITANLNIAELIASLKSLKDKNVKGELLLAYYDEGLEKAVDKIASLEAKLAVAMNTIQSSKMWLYYGCLELTAHMGIPENKRKSMIKEVVSNYDFLLEKALSEIEKL